MKNGVIIKFVLRTDVNLFIEMNTCIGNKIVIILLFDKERVPQKMMVLLFSLVIIIGLIDGKRIFDSEFDSKQNVGMTQKYFKQTVDHFNAYNTPTTFNQRWFYDTTYWNGAHNNGPFLFQAGGEGQNNGYIYV